MSLFQVGDKAKKIGELEKKLKEAEDKCKRTEKQLSVRKDKVAKLEKEVGQIVTNILSMSHYLHFTNFPYLTLFKIA